MKNRADWILAALIVLSVGLLLSSAVLEIIAISAGTTEKQGLSFRGSAFYVGISTLLVSTWLLVRRQRQSVSSKTTWKTYLLRAIASFALGGGVLIAGLVGGLFVFGNNTVDFIQIYFVPLIIVLTVAAFPIVYKFMK